MEVVEEEDIQDDVHVHIPIQDHIHVQDRIQEGDNKMAGRVGRVEYQTNLHGYYKYFVLHCTPSSSRLIQGYNSLEKAKDEAKKLAKKKHGSQYWIMAMKGRAINWG